jgi:K+-transporting ATPase ATPase C chain
VVGSSLIGQQFSEEKYFHGRPSATTAPDPQDPSKTIPAPYNAANSMGSNLGPTNKALADRIKENVDALRKENPSANVPVDLVTASGSGLDPDISPAAPCFRCREWQKPEICQRRGFVRLSSTIAAPTLGIFGEPRINVLQLNLAMDKIGS